VSSLTAAALEVVKHSLSLAQADPSKVGVRLRIAGGAVRPRFVEEPEDGDETVEVEGVRVFIAKSVLDEHGDVEVDVTPEHGNLMVRPSA
jgi:Fe-S cluster assembly iron-binding protein IscA